MTREHALDQRLKQLKVKRLGPQCQAGLWTVSLPLPPGADTELALDSATTYGKAIGKWDEQEDSSPRRLLMIGQATGTAPDELSITGSKSAMAQQTPTAETVLIEESGEPLFIWECHAMRLQWQDTTVELIMGLKTGDEIHWWEATRLVTLEETPACRVIEMGGAIPLIKNGLKEWLADCHVANPLLHKHNWLNGHVMARLHANGVCEIFAHHINSKFFDDGLPLEDAIPVIGIRVDNAHEEIAALSGEWDGTTPELTLGKVQIDLSEAAPLSTREQPGQMSEHDGFLVWQPYAGCEFYVGDYSRLTGGDGYFVHPEDKIIPRGMARTVRFSLSLSPDSPAKVARYLAPAWWYGACCELSPAPYLPVSNEYDVELDNCQGFIKTFMTRGGFEDGSVPRCEYKEKSELPFNGGEGEVPYACFLMAWRNGSYENYDDAMRQAYYFTDVYVDHAVKAARMPGYPPNAFALPHARVLGTVAAYLETGDDYLFETAEAVIETASRTHRNSWPRPAVGRDASFIRGAVMLYRYFRKPQFRDIAEKGIATVIESQRENGSFGDQGGGTGMHQFGTYITKPWMGLIATSGLLDWLELFPEHEPACACVKRFADWLMSERFPHHGSVCWTYQHDYNGKNLFFKYGTGETCELKHEDASVWHVEYLARTLLFCTLRYHDDAYVQAWEESYRAARGLEYRQLNDHRTAQAFQYLTWLQDRLWRVQLTEDGLLSRPLHFGERTPADAVVQGPDGPLELQWQDEHACSASCKDIDFRIAQDHDRSARSD